MNKNILLIGLLISILVAAGCKVNPDSSNNPSVIQEPILPELTVGPRSCENGICRNVPYCDEIEGGRQADKSCVKTGTEDKARVIIKT